MASGTQPVSRRLAWHAVRGVSRLALRRVAHEVHGVEMIPARGPFVIVARHYHHLYDGCAIIAAVPRPLQLVVTLDWLRQPHGRAAMERACEMAGWPVVPRPDQPPAVDDPRRRQDARHWRAALRASVDILHAGGGLLIFPEGFPTIDPGYTPKTAETELLPFRPGFLRIAELADRNGRAPVPIVPAGLAYARGDRWRICLRFGKPVMVAPAMDVADQIRRFEEEVRRLSGLPIPPRAASRAR